MDDDLSNLEAVILGNLITNAIAKAEANGDDVMKSMGDTYPTLLKKAQFARLLAADHLVPESAPSQVRKSARLAAASQAHEAARRGAWEAKILRSTQLVAARTAVEKCQRGLTTAEDVLADLKKSGAADHDQVLAEGAVAMWTDRVGTAERNLTKIQRDGGRP